MRILVYPHTLAIGGSQLNAVELAAAVRDQGHHVSVFATADGPLSATIKNLGLTLSLAPRVKRRPSLFIAAALREVCRREQIDLVHGYEWPPCVEGFLGPTLVDGITVGCTVMSMAVAPFIPPSIPLVVGTEQIAAAARLSRGGTVDVIEPPVDTEKNHPSIDGSLFRARYGLGGALTIVLVSRLAFALKLEGVERAIAAVQLLARDLDVRLVIVGDGAARDRVEGIAAAVNAQVGRAAIVLTGELTDPRQAYAAGDILLGMGGSALRAMAFAKPLVVLGENGFATLLTTDSAADFLWQGFYGLGDGEKSPELLARLLRPLLMTPERRGELGQFARSLVESRFSLAQAGRRQVGLYQRWLRERTPRFALVREAIRMASGLVRHKTRQRADRWRGRRATEDFNTIAQISRTAALAARSRPMPASENRFA